MNTRSGVNTPMRFKIVNQKRFNRLIIHDMEKDMPFCMHANKLALQPGLIRQFSPEDALIIGFIAGQACHDECIDKKEVPA